jgi:hypothetical protein
VSALAGGTVFYWWRRMVEEDRGRVWRLFGWFSGLMAFGSCVGAVAWAAYMMFVENLFKANTSTTKVEEMMSQALAYSWRAAFLVTYSFEFLCLSVAQLMVLDRLAAFAAPQGTRLQTLWAASWRAVMAAVVLCDVVGLAANAAAAVRYHKAAQASSTASAYYAANNTEDGFSFNLLSQQEVQRGGTILSVQLFSEVAVLLLIVIAFVVVGVLSARHLTSSLTIFDEASTRASQDERRQMAAAAATGRALRHRFVATTAFVFVTCVLRAAFSTMYALAFQLRDTVTASCRGCDECRTQYGLMTVWFTYTPEFQLLIVLVSSPVTLLVALWGMTSKSTLQLMKSSGREALFELTRVKRVLQK